MDSGLASRRAIASKAGGTPNPPWLAFEGLTGAIPRAVMPESRAGKGCATPASGAAPPSCRDADESRIAPGAAAAAGAAVRVPPARGAAAGPAPEEPCCSALVAAALLLRLPAPGAMSRSVPPSVQ